VSRLTVQHSHKLDRPAVQALDPSLSLNFYGFPESFCVKDNVDHTTEQGTTLIEIT
jgi:hypothetical protein